MTAIAAHVHQYQLPPIPIQKAKQHNLYNREHNRTVPTWHPRLLSEGTSNNSTVPAQGKGTDPAQHCPLMLPPHHGSVTLRGDRENALQRLLLPAPSDESTDASLPCPGMSGDRRDPCVTNEPLSLSILAFLLSEKEGRKKILSRTRGLAGGSMTACWNSLVL